MSPRRRACCGGAPCADGRSHRASLQESERASVSQQPEELAETRPRARRGPLNAPGRCATLKPVIFGKPGESRRRKARWAYGSPSGATAAGCRLPPAAFAREYMCLGTKQCRAIRATRSITPPSRAITLPSGNFWSRSATPSSSLRPSPPNTSACTWLTAEPTFFATSSAPTISAESSKTRAAVFPRPSGSMPPAM